MLRTIFIVLALLLVFQGVDAGEPELQDWLLYPMMFEQGGPLGNFFTDETQSDPKPIQLTLDDDKIFAVGLQNAVWVFNEPIENDSIELTEEDNHFDYLMQPDTGFRGFISLTKQDDVLVGLGRIPFLETSSSSYFLLAPADADDPREGLARCGVVSRLRPGMEAEEANREMNSPPPDDNVFEEPDLHPIGNFYALTILDESQCTDDKLWWKVRTEDGTVGWAAENSSSDYLINPKHPSEWPIFYCGDALAPRLVINGTGSVAAGFGVSKVRQSADIDTRVIMEIPEGEQFSVLEGPVCIDGAVWWRVSYKNKRGWSIEGENGDYWLEPVIPAE